ncbi:Secretion permease [Bibersteinia trehalosi USDA-ARS-USMARC-190]|uniref:Secretion permease n=1 Tax=Bibersteinia trehalosi USDA-ARS-USMARC-190 TaxID=1263832 RepID=W0RBV4_BIBTR|nr:HlyD family efflux transporter periplasmic adaptor subunit [Bibersteinia trehalosi]AHG86873.1 Secretion permease [Bibersteinia trehalosi USDA-ARS-USMARC-190]
MTQELVQLKSNILNLENEIETRKTDFDNQIIRYEMQKSDLDIRLMEQESVAEIIVNASADGIVESIGVTVGQIVKEGDVLSQIIPQNKGDYQLVVWVPNSSVSFINTDEVNIRYEAFPFEKFGQFKGKIKHISTLPASLQELSFYKNLP